MDPDVVPIDSQTAAGTPHRLHWEETEKMLHGRYRSGLLTTANSDSKRDELGSTQPLRRLRSHCAAYNVGIAYNNLREVVLDWKHFRQRQPESVRERARTSLLHAKVVIARQVEPSVVDVQRQSEEVTGKPRGIEVDVSKQRPNPTAVLKRNFGRPSAVLL
jgi:hypothetical protein